MPRSKGTVVKRKGRHKILSGYCSMGLCEGTKPKSASGKALRTCHWWLECPCKCHADIDEMFESMGMERKLMSNPEYSPDMGNFIMPDPFDETLEKPFVKKGGPIDTERVGTQGLNSDRILSGEVFAPTVSGRRAKGQLEYQVLEACNKAVVNWPEEIEITPKRIAEYIANREGIEPPSTGAIDAVWNRWVKMKFAEKGSKPVRFLGFTGGDTQTIDELERVKYKYKQDTRRQVASDKRNLRR